MLFRVLTIFPDMINRYFELGVLGRAGKKKAITVEAHDLRQWADDRYGTIDDTPYGGGAGMVMKAEPIYRALKTLKARPKVSARKQKIVLLSARGKTWNQAMAREYAKNLRSMIFICGRYEGIDERVLELVDEEISIGNFVLTGGELAAATMIDSVARLLPDVLGNQESLNQESHSVEGVLEYPQYTKPEVVRFGKKSYRVPPVLLSGNHKEVEKWRQAHVRGNVVSVATAPEVAPRNMVHNQVTTRKPAKKKPAPKSKISNQRKSKQITDSKGSRKRG